MTAGIVADNYKIEKFKKELNEQGFTNYTVSDFALNTSTIKVEVTEKQLPEIKKLCAKVELYFKRRN